MSAQSTAVEVPPWQRASALVPGILLAVTVGLASAFVADHYEPCASRRRYGRNRTSRRHLHRRGGAAGLGELDFGKGVIADANVVALWRTRGEHLPLVGEFAFQAKFEKRSDIHDKARRRVAAFFVRLQQIAQAWVLPNATKTGVVYRLKGNPPQAHE
jgi:hypothetical protein